MSSIPDDLIRVGDAVFFTLLEASTGQELWRTDGTIEGTRIVADIASGPTSSDIEPLAAHEGSLRFRRHQEIWTTDGSASGTSKLFSLVAGNVLIEQILYGNDSAQPEHFFLTRRNFNGMAPTREVLRYDMDFGTSELLLTLSTNLPIRLETIHDGRLIFTTRDDLHGTEPWYSDGTPETTGLLADINPGPGSSYPDNYFVDGSFLYFQASSPDTGTELWLVRDHQVGAEVLDIVPGPQSSYPSEMTFAGGLYVRTQVGVRKINGGTIEELPVELSPHGSPSLIGLGSKLYLFEFDSSTTSFPLISFESGVKQFIHGGFISFRGFLGIAGERVLFIADDGTHGMELWSTDGTESGTSLIIDTEPGTAGSFPNHLANIAGDLTFLTTAGVEFDWAERLLRTSDDGSMLVEIDGVYTSYNGTPGLAQGAYQYAKGILVGNTFLREIRAWNGVESTILVRHAENWSPRLPSLHINGKQLAAWSVFETNQFTHVLGTVDSNGNVDEQLGTFRFITDFGLATVGGHIYFRAHEGVNAERIWRTDGTVAGTTPLEEVSSESEFLNPIFAKEFLFADSTDGKGLVFVDGATDAVVEALNLFTGGFSEPLGDLTSATLFFRNRRELWRTQGTADSTKLVRTFAEIQAAPTAIVGDTAYFLAGSRYRSTPLSLWRSDGTPEGTRLVVELPDYLDKVQIDTFSAVDGKLFFTAIDRTTGYAEVWVSDGTPEGTLAITRNLIVDAKVEFVGYQHGIGFRAANSEVGYELFRIDTTNDIRPPANLDTATTAETTSVVWPDVRGAIQYYVWVQDLSNPDMPAVLKRVNEPRYLASADLTEGAYRIWVRSYPVLGAPSAWSSPTEFIVGNNPVMHAVSPRSLENQPTFYWSGPEDIVSYELWLTNRDTKTRTLYRTGLTGSSLTVEESLEPARYAVWVRGIRADGSMTNWSSLTEFEVMAPAIVLTAGIGDFRISRPTLRWNSVDGATGYDIRIQRRNSTEIVYRADNVKSLSHQVTLDLPAGEFEVFVRALRDMRPLSAWGSGQLLRILLPPSGLRKTQNGFAWNSVPTAVSYTLEVRNSQGELVLPMTTTEATSFTPSTPLNPGKYRLRIYANFVNASSEWSPVLAFEVFHLPVSITSPNAPTADATPIITWSAAPGAASYEVFVAQPGSNIAVHNRRGIVGTSHRIDTALPVGVNQIWVRAQFADGSRSAWSAAQHLQIGPAPVVTFANGQLKWNTVNAATHYELWINFVRSPAQQRVVHEQFYVSTSYTISSTLPTGHYHAWVRAIRAESGELYAGLWSSAVVFAVT